MFKKLYPWAYAESVFHVDYQKLYHKGYRGILFDIDNTLVHHGDDSTEEVDQLFRTLHRMGFKTLLLTNNGEKRVKRFLQNIDVPYICDADKPKTDSYEKAVAMLGLPKEEVVCIGDQMFVDIYGANQSGIASILVHYITLPGETKIGKTRYVEKWILSFYKRSRKYRDRLGDILKEKEA